MKRTDADVGHVAYAGTTRAEIKYQNRDDYHSRVDTRSSSAVNQLHLVVVGAHLRGQPLNHQLTDRAAQLLRSTQTASCYRLFALATTPPKPGLVRVGADDTGGAAIEVEVWELDAASFGDFVAQVPAPMCIGQVTLADGSDVAGFLCEPVALEDAVEITQFGGWRAYRAAATGPA